ncbi:MAG: hypothetical protein WDA12_04880 [Bacilli bacterium]
MGLDQDMSEIERLDKEQRLLLASKLGITTQAEYEEIVEGMASLRLEKVKLYGESRYELNDAMLDRKLCFSDIHRKYIRIKTAMVDESSDSVGEETRDSLLDSLLDMANYSLMAIQVLKLKEKKKPKRSPYFIEQVAICSKNPEALKEALKLIGLTEWAKDRVITEGEVWPGTDGSYSGPTPAVLNFNYQLGPFEFEILSYDNEHDNWLGQVGQESGMSHLGLHVPSIEEAKRPLVEAGYQVAQEVRTISHTNPHIKDSRRYKYCIMDTLDQFGFYLKLIERVPYNG